MFPPPAAEAEASSDTFDQLKLYICQIGYFGVSNLFSFGHNRSQYNEQFFVLAGPSQVVFLLPHIQ